jgi:hypothetical protein
MEIADTIGENVMLGKFLCDEASRKLQDSDPSRYVEESIRHQLSLVGLPTESFRMSGRYVDISV